MQLNFFVKFLKVVMKILSNIFNTKLFSIYRLLTNLFYTQKNFLFYDLCFGKIIFLNKINMFTINPTLIFFNIPFLFLPVLSVKLNQLLMQRQTFSLLSIYKIELSIT